MQELARYFMSEGLGLNLISAKPTISGCWLYQAQEPVNITRRRLKRASPVGQLAQLAVIWLSPGFPAARNQDKKGDKAEPT